MPVKAAERKENRAVKCVAQIPVCILGGRGFIKLKAMHAEAETLFF